MEIVIKVESLTKIYRRSHLGKLYTTVGLSDLSLEIYNNEIFGLIGLNGSGKTTTIKLLLGLLFPTSGSINIFDTNIPDISVLSKIGYVPELPYFQKFLTGTEILKFYCKMSKIEQEDIIEKILEIVGLQFHANKRTQEFSKGMLQRLALAQALVHNPQLFIFDEPVSGLDPLGIRDMRKFVLSLKSDGKTIFFSSHIISEAEKLCDRVGILHNSKLIRIVEKSQWQQKSLEEIFIESIEKG